jgi:hypothetical protein
MVLPSNGTSTGSTRCAIPPVARMKAARLDMPHSWVCDAKGSPKYSAARQYMDARRKWARALTGCLAAASSPSFATRSARAAKAAGQATASSPDMAARTARISPGVPPP